MTAGWFGGVACADLVVESEDFAVTAGAHAGRRQPQARVDDLPRRAVIFSRDAPPVHAGVEHAPASHPSLPVEQMARRDVDLGLGKANAVAPGDVDPEGAVVREARSVAAGVEALPVLLKAVVGLHALGGGDHDRAADQPEAGSPSRS